MLAHVASCPKTAGPRSQRRSHVFPIFRPGLRLGRSCVLGLWVLLALLPAAPAVAQEIRPLAVRFSTNDRGGILLTGNTVMTCPEAAPNCLTARQRTGTQVNNNSFTMEFIDVDSDGATLNSSDATLTLPAGATPLWAGLYWFGRNDTVASPTLARDRVLLTGPTDAASQEIVASQIDSLEPGAYQSFADVTAIVTAQTSGLYRVANVRAGLAVDSTAGWGLVIVYRDPAASLRNLTVFDGAAMVTSANPSVTATITGILTPLTGPVTGEIGTIGWEGDTGTSVFVRDGFQVNGTAQSDAVNPANDYFNSTIARLGVPITDRAPADPNSFGVDIDTVQAGSLANGLTELTLQFTTQQDRYASHVVTSAVDIFLPSLETFAKTVTDVNGGSVQPGDLLEYTISATNTGADAATAVVVTDAIPAFTTYEPNTLAVVTSPGGIAGAKTDAADADQAEFDDAGTRVLFRVGSGASSTAGGALQPTESFSVRFQVRVNANTPAGATVLNTTDAAFAAATTGGTFGVSAEAEVFLGAQAVPNLVIAKTDEDRTFARGGTGTYTVTVRNVGAAPTAGLVTMTDTPSAGLTLATLSGIGWTCDAAAATCTRSDALPVGDAYPVILATVDVAQDAPATVANVGLVSGGGELFTGDNEVSESTPVESIADLGIVKTAQPAGTYSEGLSLVYVIAVTNQGPSDVPSGAFALTDVLPAALAGAAWECTMQPLGTCSVAGGQLTIGASPAIAKAGQLLVRLQTIVPAGVSVPLENTATVALAAAGITDPVTENDSATTENVAVAAASRIRGALRDGRGTAIPDIQVALSGTLSATTTTDANGEYVFDGLPLDQDLSVMVLSTEFTFLPNERTFIGLRGEVRADFVGSAFMPPYFRYFPEGATGVFFDTRFELFNLGTTAGTAILRFQTSDGQQRSTTLSVPPLQLVVLDAETVPGLEGAVFSTVVESDQPVAISRTMRWGTPHWGQHIGLGVAAPQTTWYLAEGATGPFDLFYILQNATDQAAEVQITCFLPAPASPLVRTVTIPPHTRWTIKVNDDPDLTHTDVAARIVSTNNVPIAVERSMYIGLQGRLAEAGANGYGLPAPALRWSFAEGASGPFFDTYALLLNPETQPAHVAIRFRFNNGTALERTYVLAPESRRTILIDDEALELNARVFAMEMTSTNGVPFVAERAMWWPAGVWAGGHASGGNTEPSIAWVVPNATVDAETALFILLVNDGLSAASVEMRVRFPDGTTVGRSLDVVSGTRETISIGELFPEAIGREFSLLVNSTSETAAPLVVEYATYTSAGGQVWSLGDGGLAWPLR